MVSKSTNEKLKQGIAVRFHGEEGMVGVWPALSQPQSKPQPVELLVVTDVVFMCCFIEFLLSWWGVLECCERGFLNEMYYSFKKKTHSFKNLVAVPRVFSLLFLQWQSKARDSGSDSWFCLTLCFRVRVLFGSGLMSCLMRSSIQTMGCSLSRLMVRISPLQFLTVKWDIDDQCIKWWSVLVLCAVL